MQPLLIKVKAPQKSSFSVSRFVYKEKFPGIWHFHDQYELTLILESSGSRLVGDNIDRFYDGDLVFIGKNLPHTWRNDELHTFSKSKALVLHFLDDFSGNDFFNIPEMEAIKRILDRSHRGIKINGKTRDEVASLMLQMEHATGATKIVLLLSVLNAIAESDDLTDLASEGFVNSFADAASERLNNVYEYIMNHFQDDISLVKVASIASMSPTAFSRYFKNRTRKSFSRFLIELKIGYACKLLMKEEMTVASVCYESGFQNLSNFNAQFKAIAGMCPKKYQLMHISK